VGAVRRPFGTAPGRSTRLVLFLYDMIEVYLNILVTQIPRDVLVQGSIVLIIVHL